MPIFGMGASSYLTAAAMANSFGVISVVSGSIARHLRAIRSLGLGERLAADIAVDLSVVELSNEALTWDRMVAVGQKLRDEHGADVVILGCAGMARYRTRLEVTLGLTVIDPTQAATGMAMNAVLARRGAAVADRKAA